MENLHPATQLLIFQSLFLLLGAPAMAWFSVVVDKADRAARWWYAGLALLGVGVLAAVAVLRTTAFAACVLTLSVLVCTVAIRIEAGRTVVWPRWLTPVFLAWCALYVAIDEQGHWLHWGVPTFMFTLCILYAHLLIVLVEVGRRRHSRGLLLVGAGVVVIGVVDAIRGITALIQGYTGAIFSLALDANAVIVAVTLATVLMALGYAAFIIEKAHQLHLIEASELARAEAKALLAQEHAQAQQRIIAQRDEMLMANARFSAMNALTMFNSAIVHELSQPLQSLQSILDKIDMRVSGGDAGLRKDVGNALQVMRQMGQSLSSLRDLIASQSPSIETVDLLPVMEELSTIVETEAVRRGILFDFQIETLQQDFKVQVDRVLLHRVVLNLITNSFEAFQHASEVPASEAGQGAAVRMVRLVVGDRKINGGSMICVAIEDNGPGFTPALLAQVGYQFATTKVGGVGLGLVLSRVVVEGWGGQLRVGNRPSGPGARVELWLATA